MQGMAKLKILFHPIPYIITTIPLNNYSYKINPECFSTYPKLVGLSVQSKFLNLSPSPKI